MILDTAIITLMPDQGIDITDYDEDEHVWPDYIDGIPTEECAQHIIDWAKEDNYER